MDFMMPQIPGRTLVVYYRHATDARSVLLEDCQASSQVGPLVRQAELVSDLESKVTRAGMEPGSRLTGIPAQDEPWSRSFSASCYVSPFKATGEQHRHAGRDLRGKSRRRLPCSYAFGSIIAEGRSSTVGRKATGSRPFWPVSFRSVGRSPRGDVGGG